VFEGNLTDDQRTLIGISQMYDRVYEHPECPNDDILEDDDALDGWMIIQKRKIEKDKKQQQIDSMNPKLKNAQEVFIMANNSNEADEVVSLNSSESLNRMKSKINHVQKFGFTEESQLPDVQIDLRNQLNQQIKNRK
jgi:pyruvate dehydrogenase complex dehydrogenase (E1) component